MSSVIHHTRDEHAPHPVAYPPPLPDELSVVVAARQRAGNGVAELWRGSALLGMLCEQEGDIVLRLESHARGPLTVSAVALERALAEARERLTDAVQPGPRPLRVPTRDSMRDSS